MPSPTASRRTAALYCPTAFPALTDADWKTLAESDYKGRSALILGKFLTDFTAEELADFASKAYADEKFGGADTAPVVKLWARARTCSSCGTARPARSRIWRCRCCRTC